MTNVLITGGSGLIGQRLSALLLSKGYAVGHLTRTSTKGGDSIKSFVWNVDRNEIDEAAIPWAHHIIHLAGETVGQRWTKTTKENILQSRVASTKLLIAQLKNNNHHLKSFVCASAIGYYGEDTGDNLLIEASAKGIGFLANVVAELETTADEVAAHTERLVKIRAGIVLAENGGALNKMIKPIKWGLGDALGSGKQWMSWIHIDDLCQMYLRALEQPLAGVFNGVAPNPVTNKEFTKILASQLKIPLFLPNVPSLVLKLLLGEMAILALGSNKVAPVAFQKEDFTFEHKTVENALAALI